MTNAARRIEYLSDLEPFETSWSGTEVLVTLDDGREFEFSVSEENIETGGRYLSFDVLSGGAEAEKFLARNERKLEDEWDKQPKYYGRFGR